MRVLKMIIPCLVASALIALSSDSVAAATEARSAGPGRAADNTPIDGAAHDTAHDTGKVETIEAVLDSLRNSSATDSDWDKLAQSAGWDTLDTGNWVPNADLSVPRQRAWRRFRQGIRPHFGFNKVDGYVPGLGVSLQWMKRPGLRLEGAMLRSSGRGRYQGEIIAGWQRDTRSALPYSWSSRTRVTGGSKESHLSPFAGRTRSQRAWALFGGYSERTVAFGSNRPVANAAQSLYLALDEQNYLDRIESFGGIRLQKSRTLSSEWVYIDRRDRSIVSSRSPHLQTSPGSWKNAASDGVHLRGVAWMGRWVRRGRMDLRDGVWWKASAWGGQFGGDREFYTTGLEARHSLPVPGSGSVELEAWAAVVGGDAPRQELADLGGASSLRGYADRSQVGTTSLLLRTNYNFGTDLLAESNLPGLRSLHLQPVIFFDIGAVWGDDGWRSVSDLTLPENHQWKSDVGIGIQRLVNYPGLLQRVRVDFAWRLDRSKERFRTSLSVTR